MACALAICRCTVVLFGALLTVCVFVRGVRYISRNKLFEIVIYS